MHNFSDLNNQYYNTVRSTCILHKVLLPSRELLFHFSLFNSEIFKTAIITKFEKGNWVTKHYLKITINKIIYFQRFKEKKYQKELNWQSNV